MTLEEREQAQIRARDAEILLANPLLKAAFSECREALVRQMETMDATEERQRDVFVLSLQLLNGIKDRIESHIETGYLTEMPKEDF